MSSSLPLVFNAPRRGMPPRHLADLDADERKAGRSRSWGSRDSAPTSWPASTTGSSRADPDKMTDLPAGMREKVGAALFPQLLSVVRHVFCNAGQTRKSCGRRNDGTLLESVLMRYPDRATLCASRSQAGCGMACPFCATGQAGLTRNLSTAESRGPGAGGGGGDGASGRGSELEGEPAAMEHRVHGHGRAARQLQHRGRRGPADHLPGTGQGFGISQRGR